MDRLNRIKLLLGASAVDKLRDATVMVVGCGAVGSFAIEALARSGVGRFILIDNDAVEASNINRQLFALTSTIGNPKVDVASARIRDINPDACVDARCMFWDASSDLDVAPDIVVDAIDTIDSKIALYAWCAARNIPCVTSMGAARKRDISSIRVAPISQTSVCPLAAKIRRRVRDDKLPDFMAVYSTEPAAPGADDGRVFGSIVTVTGAFGLHLANLVIDCLVK